MQVLYFSGTGNSFYAAKYIADRVPGSELVSIARLKDAKTTRLLDPEVVVVCPIYFYGLPPIVVDFLRGHDFATVEYLSFVFTAEYPNGRAVSELRGILGGVKSADSCFYIKMPTNYVIGSRMLSGAQIETVLADADARLDRAVDTMRGHRRHIDNDSRIYALVVGAKRSWSKWRDGFADLDSRFAATDACTGCGLCEINCPVGNIRVDAGPVWDGRCEACLKCINICPVRAIQYDGRTEGRSRYFNPRVRLADFK